MRHATLVPFEDTIQFCTMVQQPTHNIQVTFCGSCDDWAVWQMQVVVWSAMRLVYADPEVNKNLNGPKIALRCGEAHPFVVTIY